MLLELAFIGLLNMTLQDQCCSVDAGQEELAGSVAQAQRSAGAHEDREPGCL